MATVDLDQLRTMTSGDAELAVEALAIFRSQADLWGRMLDGNGDRQQWADACHTIKGAARSVGAYGNRRARSRALSPGIVCASTTSSATTGLPAPRALPGSVGPTLGPVPADDADPWHDHRSLAPRPVFLHVSR